MGPGAESARRGAGVGRGATHELEAARADLPAARGAAAGQPDVRARARVDGGGAGDERVPNWQRLHRRGERAGEPLV